MSEVPPVQGADATPPPPQSRGAVDHQGRGASWGVGHMIGVANNQTRGIQAGTYYAKILQELQKILAEVNAALLDMLTNPDMANFNKLRAALRDLHSLKQVSAKQWGGNFGIGMGEQIAKRVKGIYDAVLASLGTLEGGSTKGGWGPQWAKLLSDPGAPPSAPNFWANMVGWVKREVEQGKDPLNAVQVSVNEQSTSVAEFTALLQAQLTRLKNNGITALQTAGKFVSMFWKVIIQMISGIQQG